MEIYKDATQTELAKLIKNWDLAADLLDDYIILPRTEKGSPLSGLGYLVVPLPETKIWKDEEGYLYIDDELVSGNREFWKESLRDIHLELDLISIHIAAGATALAALEDEKISARRNELAESFEYMLGYDKLPDKSPLKLAIDYIIDNEKKEAL